MELETVNKLYLELSQVATATTAKEQAAIDYSKKSHKVLCQIMDAIDGHCEWSPHPESDNFTWNPDAHIEVTLTVRDCRAIKKAMELFEEMNQDER